MPSLTGSISVVIQAAVGLRGWGVANGLGKPIVTHLRDVVEIPEHHPNLNYQIKRPQRGRMHVAQGELGLKAPAYPGSMYERRTHPEWVHVELEDNRVAIRAPL